MILLSSIHIYPCKGLAGISVPQVEIDDFGPKHDRRWMLGDENNDFFLNEIKDIQGDFNLLKKHKLKLWHVKKKMNNDALFINSMRF